MAIFSFSIQLHQEREFIFPEQWLFTEWSQITSKSWTQVSLLPTTCYVPPFCFNHIWRQTRSLNEPDTSKRKYKFKLLNYFEIHPRYSSKKYFDDLGKYMQLRLRRINRAARTTIYLASWKTFIAKERYGVVPWQEVKKHFFGSTDSDALSSKKNFPPEFSWCVYLTY